ncbi:hypothetical protein [Acidiplasma cupricumulans]|uniref:hypothetical protein n=1 Tax=Acidiplasma cupricumulans TaxID=312540 RepID=UPI001584A122|nr:hypothetical protein [Acidiplasma cupricumulans]
MEKSEILRAIIRQGENEDISEYEEILNEANENLVYPDIFLKPYQRYLNWPWMAK